MSLVRTYTNVAVTLLSMVRYNLKIIFAGKFVYFLAAAVGIFLFVVMVNLMNADAQANTADVFFLLLVPGLLLMFYPVTFGIQNDVDNRMIEILFGIPNYRYKVWLFRLLVIFGMIALILTVLTALSGIALTTIAVPAMLYHLMFPIIFLGCVTFLMSTVVRNGSGTAVAMVILILICWVARDFFEQYPQWDVFLNPFQLPQNMNETVWAEIVRNNRLFLLAGGAAAVLSGLLNLQKREKFL